MLRTADDALEMRAFAQRHAPRRAVVAGGGLLGLEAAYALHKLGLRTPCSSAPTGCCAASSTRARPTILRRYLEGLGSRS